MSMAEWLDALLLLALVLLLLLGLLGHRRRLHDGDHLLWRRAGVLLLDGLSLLHSLLHRLILLLDGGLLGALLLLLRLLGLWAG